MPSPSVTIDDVEHRWEGSRIDLRIDGNAAQLQLTAVGDAAVEAALAEFSAALESGDDVAAAIERTQRAAPAVAGRFTRHELTAGAVLFDDTAARTTLEVRRSLAVLAELTRGRARSIVIVGQLDCAPSEWFDDHDSLGRLAVRLDVSQLIVVGEGARHIHNAAGLEGSWDGESVLVETAREAYDVVRAQFDGGEVILVTGAAHTSLSDVVDLLAEADR